MSNRGLVRSAQAMIGAIAVGLALVASGTSGPSASLLAPGATLDQSNPVRASTCRYTGWIPDDAASWAAQTFTAGRSGALSDVVLPMRVGTPQFTIAIAAVGANGQPVVSTPLASTNLALAATQSYVDVAVSFATPARVEAGKQYAIVLTSPTTPLPDTAWKADLGSSLKDQIGTPCGDGAYAGGRVWVSNDGLGPDADFFFQTYVVPARHVTVATTGTGTGSVQDSTHALDCGSTCTAEFLQGQTVALTATPDPDSTFSGWLGDRCTGIATTCSFLVTDEDAAVTASFTKKLVTLTVRRVGRGTVTSDPSGIRCGQQCRHAFVPGPVTLTATPSPGWKFTRWQGACRGTKPRCGLALAGGTAVAAFFVKAPHTK